MTTSTFSEDQVTRKEFTELFVETGQDNAASLIVMRLAFRDETRLKAARFLCPPGYLVVQQP